MANKKCIFRIVHLELGAKTVTFDLIAPFSCFELLTTPAKKFH